MELYTNLIKFLEKSNHILICRAVGMNGYCKNEDCNKCPFQRRENKEKLINILKEKV